MSEPPAAKGGRLAWDALVREHNRKLVLFIVRRGFALHIAEELANETWTRLYSRALEGRLPRVELPGLAFREAEYVMGNWRRSRDRREIPLTALGPGDDGPTEYVPEVIAPETPERQLGRAEVRRQVRTAVDQLPPRQREVADMYYGQELKAPEIARTLGITQQRVCELLCELRRRVAKHLKEEG